MISRRKKGEVGNMVRMVTGSEVEGKDMFRLRSRKQKSWVAGASFSKRQPVHSPRTIRRLRQAICDSEALVSPCIMHVMAGQAPCWSVLMHHPYRTRMMVGWPFDIPKTLYRIELRYRKK
jgi:hypothetical protein